MQMTHSRAPFADQHSNFSLHWKTFVHVENLFRLFSCFDKSVLFFWAWIVPFIKKKIVLCQSVCCWRRGNISANSSDPKADEYWFFIFLNSKMEPIVFLPGAFWAEMSFSFLRTKNASKCHVKARVICFENEFTVHFQCNSKSPSLKL